MIEIEMGVLVSQQIKPKPNPNLVYRRDVQHESGSTLCHLENTLVSQTS